MLVGARDHEHVVAGHALVPGEDVRRYAEPETCPMCRGPFAVRPCDRTGELSSPWLQPRWSDPPPSRWYPRAPRPPRRDDLVLLLARHRVDLLGDERVRLQTLSMDTHERQDHHERRHRDDRQVLQTVQRQRARPRQARQQHQDRHTGVRTPHSTTTPRLGSSAPNSDIDAMMMDAESAPVTKKIWRHGQERQQPGERQVLERRTAGRSRHRRRRCSPSRLQVQRRRRGTGNTCSALGTTSAPRTHGSCGRARCGPGTAHEGRPGDPPRPVETSPARQPRAGGAVVARAGARGHGEEGVDVRADRGGDQVEHEHGRAGRPARRSPSGS